MKNLVLSSEYEVIGLEARDRVGGRVFTDENMNEIGASWIHGTERECVQGDKIIIEENPVHQLAKECIPEEDFYNTPEFTVVSSDGTRLECLPDMWERIWDILNVVKNSEEAKENAFKPSMTSVYDFIKKNYLDLFPEILGKKSKSIIKSIIEWQSYYATLWEETSIGSMAVDKEFGGDQLLIKKGGYSRILKHYLDHYKLREHINLNSPVERIHRQSNGTILLFIKDSEVVVEADIVVVTVPLGVLKNKGIQFEPPLPVEKEEAIQKLGFGIYDKIFITFKDSIEQNPENASGFWIPGAHTISIVPKADDDYEQYLLAADDESIIANPPRPYYSRDEDHIGIEVTNISEIVSVPRIVMFFYGPSALKMESLSRDNGALTEFALSKLRNAFPDREFPEVESVQATTWGCDPFAYGSFANIPLGSSGQDMVTLSEPVDDKILFAGEATFPLHYSTVHGALKSGRREFARINKIYHPERPSEYEKYLI